jgi:serine phosphatase RsbU (regulator of sigma subunit)
MGIAVGDVSGKGMQAALMMTLSFGLLTNQLRHSVAPAELLAELNSEIHPHTQRNNLNTAMCYLTIQCADPSGRREWRLRVANAGLVAPLVRYPNGKVEWLDVRGFPLGMVTDIYYRELEQALVPGTQLILSSDGIVEAMNIYNELYGFDRLVQRLASAPGNGHSAQALLDWILTDVRAFVGEAEAHDDVTMVAIVVQSSPV